MGRKAKRERTRRVKRARRRREKKRKARVTNKQYAKRSLRRNMPKRIMTHFESWRRNPRGFSNTWREKQSQTSKENYANKISPPRKFEAQAVEEVKRFYSSSYN